LPAPVLPAYHHRTHASRLPPGHGRMGRGAACLGPLFCFCDYRRVAFMFWHRALGACRAAAFCTACVYAPRPAYCCRYLPPLERCACLPADLFSPAMILPAGLHAAWVASAACLLEPHLRCLLCHTVAAAACHACSCRRSAVGACLVTCLGCRAFLPFAARFLLPFGYLLGATLGCSPAACCHDYIPLLPPPPPPAWVPGLPCRLRLERACRACWNRLGRALRRHLPCCTACTACLRRRAALRLLPARLPPRTWVSACRACTTGTVPASATPPPRLAADSTSPPACRHLC